MTPPGLAVVTGASGGIGEAIARRLAADGTRVVLLARRAQPLQQLAGELGGAAYPVDLADGEATADVCRRILAEEGTPDLIVNNAGAGRFRSIEETSNGETRQQMELPYRAAFHVTRGFIEAMLARGHGTIMQINSPVAVVPWPGAVGYAAARFALRGFTEALRQDLHGTGINVASLSPSRVHSGYFDANPGSLERVPKVGVDRRHHDARRRGRGGRAQRAPPPQQGFLCAVAVAADRTAGADLPLGGGLAVSAHGASPHADRSLGSDDG